MKVGEISGVFLEQTSYVNNGRLTFERRYLVREHDNYVVVSWFNYWRNDDTWECGSQIYLTKKNIELLTLATLDKAPPERAPARVPVIYIAGKFTGPDSWAIAQNVHAARELGMRVALSGAMPLIPHANTSEFFGTLTESFWYAGTMELLERCDAVVFGNNWQDSTGSKVEFERAREKKMEIFYDNSNELERMRLWVINFFKDWVINFLKDFTA